MFCGIDLRTSSHGVPQNLTHNMCLEITLLKVLPHLTRTKELKPCFKKNQAIKYRLIMSGHRDTRLPATMYTSCVTFQTDYFYTSHTQGNATMQVIRGRKVSQQCTYGGPITYANDLVCCASCQFSMASCDPFNSLWPSDIIWQQRSRWTLAQVMTCCQTAPSHYLNQCWLIIISVVLWYSPEPQRAISQKTLKISILDMNLKIYDLRLQM